MEAPRSPAVSPREIPFDAATAEGVHFRPVGGSCHTIVGGLMRRAGVVNE